MKKMILKTGRTFEVFDKDQASFQPSNIENIQKVSPPSDVMLGHANKRDSVETDDVSISVLFCQPIHQIKKKIANVEWLSNG
ncbi:hypothetical protein Avbf_16294 [Armadillidium vulgare]|nr:hypothetical protein Avbf_16294 [Armadillidium vulgare]